MIWHDSSSSLSSTCSAHAQTGIISSSRINSRLTAFDARRKSIIPRLIPERAVRIRIARIHTPKRTSHDFLRPILLTATPSRNAEVARQIARLEDNPWTAALRLAFLTYSERATRVLGVADVEGDLSSGAIPGAVAETVVLEPAAGRAEPVKIVLEWLAAVGVIFGLVGDLAFDTDVQQSVDGCRGGGFGVAVWKKLAGGFEAAVWTGGDLRGSGATWVEWIGRSVGVSWRWCCSS
jgi:hypothetical protein